VDPLARLGNRGMFVSTCFGCNSGTLDGAVNIPSRRTGHQNNEELLMKAMWPKCRSFFR
jgi:hypothetical protein